MIKTKHIYTHKICCHKTEKERRKNISTATIQQKKFREINYYNITF
jgi:hypothetical protein